MSEKIKKSSVYGSLGDGISLSSEAFVDILSVVIQGEEKERMVTGFKQLNDSLSGGYKKSCVYLYRSNEATLLNVLLNNLMSIRKNNKLLPTLSPAGRKQRILFISTELPNANLVENVIDIQMGLDLVRQGTMSIGELLHNANLGADSSLHDIIFHHIPKQAANTESLLRLIAQYENLSMIIIDRMDNIDTMKREGFITPDVKEVLHDVAVKMNIPIITGQVIDKRLEPSTLGQADWICEVSDMLFNGKKESNHFKVVYSKVDDTAEFNIDVHESNPLKLKEDLV